jgi:myosin-crossreactive antigen
MELERRRIRMWCSEESTLFGDEIVEVILKLVQDKFSGVTLFGILTTLEGREFKLDFETQLKPHRNDQDSDHHQAQEFKYGDVLPQPKPGASSSFLGDQRWKTVVMGKV